MSESGYVTREEQQKITLIQLVEIDPCPIQSWHELMQHWDRAQKAGAVDEMTYLLHIGWRVNFDWRRYGEPQYEHKDRLLFYFFYADGWADKDLLRNKTGSENSFTWGHDDNGYSVSKTSSEVRQLVAQKAFDILSAKYFKGASVNEHNNAATFPWSPHNYLWPLLDTIMDFFRVEKNVYSQPKMVVRNYPTGWRVPAHKEEPVKKFLLALAHFLWGYEEKEIESWWKKEEQEEVQRKNSERRAQVEKAMPWMIEVLQYMGEIAILRKWLFQLNNECLAKLEEIALRNEISEYYYPVKKSRLVTNLDEACLVNSTAAWLLKERELKTKARKHLQNIFATEERKEKLEAELARLNSSS